MTSPEVSIIITNYNYSKYLARCIRSCLSQQNVNCEVIVVDDCSTDNSLEVLEPFMEEIKVIRNKKNMGVAASSNAGIKKSRSQYVIRVDADDFINSETCYFMKSYLEANHDAFGLACDYVLVDNHEDVIERKSAEKDNISCGIMYRRDLLLDMGGYNPKMRHREEEELRKRLGEFYNIHYLKMPFYRYRMHNDNKTKEPEYKTWKI
jgi:glycosyltransferase involved in cell wall biosynthesis|tara:strand:- start:1811 stop:2431 length:621 start_codon:yes stop_codon:yes gene_type:complete